MPQLRLCPDCGFEKVLNDFYNIRNGKSRYCKEHQKKRITAYNLRNHEAYKKRLRLYYQNNKVKATVANKIWRQNHPEQARKYKRKWILANAETNLESKRSWARRNREYMKVKGAREAGIRRNAEGKFCLLDIKELYLNQHGCCVYCGKNLFLKFEIDHEIPICRGGSNWPNNLVLSCPTCNQQKGKRTPEEYLQWRKQLEFSQNNSITGRPANHLPIHG